MDEKYKRRTVLTGVGLGALGFLGGAAAAVGTSFTETIKTSYGDVQRVESDVRVTNVQTDGAGINVDTVIVSVENGSESTISFTCDVYIMDGTNVASEGTESLSLDAGETADLSVDIPRTRGNQYDQIDVQITED